MPAFKEPPVYDNRHHSFSLHQTTLSIPLLSTLTYRALEILTPALEAGMKKG